MHSDENEKKKKGNSLYSADKKSELVNVLIWNWANVRCERKFLNEWKVFLESK